MPELCVRRLSPHASLPRRMTEGAAGYDLAACLPDGHSVCIEPGRWTTVPTGVAMAIPVGYEGQVRPRSGLAVRRGVTVLNAPGTIDADYRGEVKVILINHGREPFVVEHGDRIAQLVIAAVADVRLTEVSELPGSARDVGGFGSTGTGAPS